MIKPLSTIVSIAGLLVILLAFAQIFATPLVSGWLGGAGRPDLSPELSLKKSFVQMFVGILMIPFGISTVFAAVGIHAGQRWARGICYTNAAVIMLLPLLAEVLFGSFYFDSALSVVINSLTVAAGGAVILSLIWLER